VASSTGHTGAGASADSFGDLDDASLAGLGTDSRAGDDREAEDPVSSDLSRRLFALLTGLLRIHAQIAAAEARRDQARLVRGLISFVLAGFLGLLSLLLVEGLALWGLVQLPLRWPLALAALIGCNLTLAGLLALLGRQALRAPVMPETRALLRRTLRSLFPV